MTSIIHQPVPLLIKSIFYEDNSTKKMILKSFNPSIQVAMIIKGRYQICPNLNNLNGIKPEINNYLLNLLLDCQSIKIIKSLKLNHKNYKSITLLYLEPPLFLINGTDQNSIDTVGNIVDNFIAAHSVLEILWEPIYPYEPRWWILAPRKKGMPG